MEPNGHKTADGKGLEFRDRLRDWGLQEAAREPAEDDFPDTVLDEDDD